jgi:protein-disulfide isomerase
MIATGIRPHHRAFTLLFAVLVTSASAATIDVIEGNPSASVRVTIYEDLQCDYCQSLRTMLDEKLLPRYGKTVAFIHHDLPLGRHDWARPAAMVARWVQEQSSSLGIQFRRELLDEQEHITPANLKFWVVEFARRNKLNEQGIVAAMTDPRLAAMVDQDIQTAAARGIRKIPAVYVAGQSFVETIIYDDVARVLDNALAR